MTNPPSPFAAILFDFDDLLLDSEPIHFDERGRRPVTLTPAGRGGPPPKSPRR